MFTVYTRNGMLTVIQSSLGHAYIQFFSRLVKSSHYKGLLPDGKSSLVKWYISESMIPSSDLFNFSLNRYPDFWEIILKNTQFRKTNICPLVHSADWTKLILIFNHNVRTMKYICNRNASALHPLLFRANYYDLNLVLGYSFDRAE